MSAGTRRFDVLRALKAAPDPMSITAIADELGVHPNTVRFHLDTLLDNGLVEQVEPDHRRPGRPPQLFRAVRRMNPGGPRRYKLLAEVLSLGYSAEPNPSAKALEAGRAWGRRLKKPEAHTDAPAADASITQLVDALDELGFAPERQGDVHIGLRHCPFLELAEHSSTVVCPVHLGLMQGALQNWAAPVTVDRLEAFVEPDLCLAHLSTREANA
ncbi:MAG TPA: helix-turn-helix domain-containing protein [Mycobacterium sp.]|jgi:predicted ArsR family transcriptional regulator